MAFSNNLKQLREKKGLSQEQLAEHLNIPRSTLTHYESQTNKRLPRMDRLQLIADYFAVSIDQLVSNTCNDISQDTMKQLKSADIPKGLPIIATIRVGLSILDDENIEGYLDVPDYMNADYILRVKGDSMVGAGILDGDLVICKEAQTALSGQIVAALHDEATGFSEATLKYYFDAKGNGSVLRPANPDYSEIQMKNTYRIAGVMVALLRSEAPGYQVYKNYLAANDSEEWTEVIELATSTGIKPERMKSFIDMINEMGKGK